MCGPGNNGGDGFAAARHLANRGRNVRIRLAVPAIAYPENSDAGTNLAICQAMGLPCSETQDLEGAALVVDALFGTGLARQVRDPYKSLIEAVNAAAAPTVAIDLPSGLDADTGATLGAAVRAEVTLTMVAPKVGFALGDGPALVGEVETIDIGAPPEALRRATTEQA